MLGNRERDGLQRDTRKLLGVLQMLILIVEINFKHVQLILFQLYLNNTNKNKRRYIMY